MLQFKLQFIRAVRQLRNRESKPGEAVRKLTRLLGVQYGLARQRERNNSLYSALRSA
jgi:hypothetical protein